MKNHTIVGLSLTVAFLAIAALGFYSFKSPQNKKVDWMQLTVVESVVEAGIGRSRMITLDKDGKMEEVKLKNFFSVTGINFSNIRENDQAVTNKINELTNDGWELYDITTGVYSGNDKTNNGIFLTRYLFRK